MYFATSAARSAFDPFDTKGGLLVAPNQDCWQEILATLLRPAAAV